MLVVCGACRAPAIMGQPREGMSRRTAPGHLPSMIILAHAAEPVPAGADQGRDIPALGDGLGRVVPVLECVPVARLPAAPVSPAVHVASFPPLHRRRLARRPAP